MYECTVAQRKEAKNEKTSVHWNEFYTTHIITHRFTSLSWCSTPHICSTITLQNPVAFFVGNFMHPVLCKSSCEPLPLLDPRHIHVARYCLRSIRLEERASRGMLPESPFVLVLIPGEHQAISSTNSAPPPPLRTAQRFFVSPGLSARSARFCGMPNIPQRRPLDQSSPCQCQMYNPYHASKAIYPGPTWLSVMLSTLVIVALFSKQAVPRQLIEFSFPSPW